MSEEEDDIDEEEEEEEEEDEDGEGEDEGEEAKEKSVKDDISLVLDIFAYIDRTSKRMASRLETEAALAAPRKTLDFPPGIGMNHEDELVGDAGGAGGVGVGGGGGGGEMHWSNYGNLTEAPRGELLEKAIMTLGEPQLGSAGGGGAQPSRKK